MSYVPNAANLNNPMLFHANRDPREEVQDMRHRLGHIQDWTFAPAG